MALKPAERSADPWLCWSTDDALDPNEKVVIANESALRSLPSNWAKPCATIGTIAAKTNDSSQYLDWLNSGPARKTLNATAI